MSFIGGCDVRIAASAAHQVIDGEPADDHDVQRQHGDEDRHEFEAAGLRLHVASIDVHSFVSFVRFVVVDVWS